MRAATTTRPLAVLTALLALIVCAMAPAAQADNRILLESGHTDAFYILTEGGVPEVVVDNRGDRYTPGDTIFRIQASTYSTEHELTGPFDGPVEGYFSGALASGWFEPGWNAPGFRRHFASMRIDFTKVTGPGRVLLAGNSSIDDETDPRQAYLADGSYDVVTGASLPITGHEHAHWFFTHAGEYQLTGMAVGTRADGTEVASEPFTVAFRVERNAQDTRAEAPSQPTTAPGTEPTTAPAPTAQPSTQPGTEPTTEPTTPSSSVFDTHEPYRLTHGHVDLFSVIAKDGRLVMAAKDESTGKMVVRQPEDVTVVVGESTRRELKGDLASALVPSGYFLPESGQNQQEAPFPGWDTFSAEPDFPTVDIEFVDVTGPGRVFLFTTARSALSSQLVSGKYELNDGEVIHMEDPGHVHTNWLFEKPGTYTMTVRAKGESLESGDTVTSQPATYTWVVGESAPTPEPTATASSTAGTEPTSAPSTSAPATSAPGGDPSATPSSTASTGPSPTGSASATPSASATASTPGGAPLAAGGGAAGSGLGGGSGTGGGSGLARTGAGTMTLVGMSLATFAGGSAFLAARRRQA